MEVGQLPRLALSLPPRASGQEPADAARLRRSFARTFQTMPLSARVPFVSQSFHRKFDLSSARLMSIRDSWSQFSQACCILIELCELNRTSPSFVVATHQFSKLFTHFNRFAVVILNSIHADGDPRARIEQSGIWRSGRLLVSQWRFFVARLNEVALGPRMPILPLVVNAVDAVAARLADVAKLFFVGSLQSVIPRYVTVAIHEALDDIRRAARPPADAAGTFDVSGYYEKVSAVAESIEYVFLGPMPRYTSKTSEIIRQRMQLKIALQELTRLADALVTFDDVATHVRRCVVDLNAEMAGLFQELGLPWRLPLSTCGVTQLEFGDDGEIAAAKPVGPPSSAGIARSPRRRFTCLDKTSA
jgi:hypothetical protein